MKLLKNILAVVVGYAIFVISTVLLFKISAIDAHADPSVGVMILVIAWGMVFSIAGGLVAQMISASGNLTINYILGIMIAGFATFSLFNTTGNHYSQLAAIFLFAPSSILAGLTYLKKRKS
jgi:hypothetical protein